MKTEFLLSLMALSLFASNVKAQSKVDSLFTDYDKVMTNANISNEEGESDSFTKSVRYNDFGGKKNSIFLSGAGGVYISKFDDGKTNKRGVGCMEYSVDYMHIIKNGSGFGISTSFSNGKHTYDIRTCFLGASYVNTYTTKNNWNWTESLGLGFSYMCYGGPSCRGLGVFAQISCVKKLSKYIGIGAYVRVTDGLYSANEDLTGYGNITLGIGPRFFF